MNKTSISDLSGHTSEAFDNVAANIFVICIGYIHSLAELAILCMGTMCVGVNILNTYFILFDFIQCNAVRWDFKYLFITFCIFNFAKNKIKINYHITIY